MELDVDYRTNYEWAKRVHGNPQPFLNDMHRYLMGKGFPYHSVSVIYQHGSFRCIFDEKVKDKVTEDVLNVMDDNYKSTQHIGVKFAHFFVKVSE